MHYAYPQNSAFLVLAFAAAGLAVFALVRKRRALRRLARQGIHQPGVFVSPVRQLVRCALLLLAAALLGVALLGPQWGWIEQEVPPHRGRDVIVLLDVSRSMLAEDVSPSRLERARADLRDLADHLERVGGYRIGLITFAERAAVLCPLTSDFHCFAEELADASLKSLRLRGQGAWGDGTQISTALDRAGRLIEEDNAAYTDVLLISDGDDMAAETLAAADALARRGVAVHTLGLGDPDHGSLIPVRDDRGRPANLRYRGELVYSHLQEDVLREIAERTHGRYFPVGTGYLDLDRAFGDLLAGKESLERQIVHRERHGIHRFQWFVAAALGLLFIQWLLSDARRSRREMPQTPEYFRWVRRRSEERANHRVAESTEKDTKKQKGKTARKPQVVMGCLFCVFLCVLCDSVVSSLFAGPAQPVDPWTAFRRGNELLRQAQQAGTKADPAWLIQAQRQYQKCLARQAATPSAGTLFDDARYNLELTKLLLAQVSRSGTNAGRPDASSSPDEGGADASPDDDEKEADGKQRSAKRDGEKTDTDSEGKKASGEKTDTASEGKKSSGESSEPREPSAQPKKGDGEDGEKDSEEAKKDRSEKQKDDNDKSSQKPKREDRHQKKNTAKKGSSSGGSGNKKSEAESKSKSDEASSGSGESDARRKKQRDEKQEDEDDRREKKPKKDKKDDEKQDDESDRGKSSGTGTAPADSTQPAADPEGKRSTGRDASQTSEDTGSVPSPSGRAGEDKQRGRGREPDASGLFGPQSPDPKEKQPGRGTQEDSRGGGPDNRAAAQRELDPVEQAALMRLQAAIQRIENRRGRRMTGPAPGPEDPANLKRYRDW